MLLIGNPRARRGDQVESLVPDLRALGLQVALQVPDGQDALLRLIRERGPKVDRIAIAGGDGSIAAALPALLEVGTPLAVIPLGTANDLARNLGLPDARDAQLALVRSGTVRRIDLGSANGRPFLNAASVGLGAAVAALHSGEAKRWLGVLNYPRVLYLAWRRTRPFTVEITCDGERHEGAFVHVAVVNGRFHGGGLEPRPTSSIADAKLDLYALRSEPVSQLIRHLAALRVEGAFSPDIFHLVGRRITMVTDRSRRVNIDGELVPETPLELTVLPQALAVIAPD